MKIDKITETPMNVLLEDLPMRSYLQMHDYLSGSMLSTVIDRADIFKYRYIDGNHKADTNNTKLGSLTHTLFMEPEKYDDEYHLIPDTYTNNKGTQSKWVEKTDSDHVKADIEAANGKCRIKSRQLEEATIYSEALSHNYIDLPGQKLIEPTMLCKGDKVSFKSRPDILYPDACIADNIKTAASINPNDVFSSALGFGYDVSAALTAYCFKKVFNKDLKDYRIVVVEKSDTTPVQIFSCNKPMYGPGSMTFLQFGMKRLEKAIEKYLWCMDNNLWEPGKKMQPKWIEVMKVPFWAIKELDMTDDE